MLTDKLPLNGLNPETAIAFFTGAGISVESGLETFRDLDGHWRQYDPMTLASPGGFQSNPELVWSWYGERYQRARAVKPNAGHRAIADFQKLFPNTRVITQNVDGLHQRAGSERVLELHGNLNRLKCFHCGRGLEGVPGGSLIRCGCGGLARPDVVWFGENLDPEVLESAGRLADQSTLFFVVGTSAQIFPAAQLPQRARRKGSRIIEINPRATPLSPLADVSLRVGAGEAIPRILKEFHEIYAT